MPSLRVLLLIVAAVIFALAAAWSPPAPSRYNLVALGLLMLTVSFLVP